MEPKFSIKFLSEAVNFINTVDDKSREKILFNLNKASRVNDSTLFKKLNSTIWEFRTLYNKKTYRLFAFWDKSSDESTLVICTHGIIKKTQKTPKSDLEKAEKLRKTYFESKNIEDE